MEPNLRFELRTFALQERCSKSTELIRLGRACRNRTDNSNLEDSHVSRYANAPGFLLLFKCVGSFKDSRDYPPTFVVVVAAAAALRVARMTNREVMLLS